MSNQLQMKWRQNQPSFMDNEDKNLKFELKYEIIQNEW